MMSYVLTILTIFVVTSMFLGAIVFSFGNERVGDSGGTRFSNVF